MATAPIPASMMGHSAMTSTQSNFFSLPRELRDQIYGCLLVDYHRPIFFDSVNGFMPMAGYLQDGILATFCKAIPSMAVEMLEIFYKHNHFIVKCVDIPILTNFASYQVTTAPLLYPRSYVMHLTVLVDCTELSHSSLRLLLIWDRLRTAIVEIRGSYKAVEELCGKVIDIAGTCDLLKKRLGPGLRVVMTGQPSQVDNKWIHTKADISGLWSPPTKMEWYPALKAEENNIWWHATHRANLASISPATSVWHKKERKRLVYYVCKFHSLKRRSYQCPEGMETFGETTERFMKSDPEAVMEASADGDSPIREAKLRFSPAGTKLL